MRRKAGTSEMHYFNVDVDAIKFIGTVPQGNISIFKAGRQWCVIITQRSVDMP